MYLLLLAASSVDDTIFPIVVVVVGIMIGFVVSGTVLVGFGTVVMVTIVVVTTVCWLVVELRVIISS